jgi:hypothetical protein
MKRTIGVLAMVAVAGLFVARAQAGDKKDKKGAAPAAKTENCGAMMKDTAKLPAKFAELMTAIADGQTAHANWVGMGKDAASQAEAAAIKKIAQDHRDLAAAAKKAAADMEAAATLTPAPHDPAKMDQKAMQEQMTKNLALEREMANMMLKHADESEKMMKDKMGGGAPASK